MQGGFLLKLSATGQQLIYSTYLGGGGEDSVVGMRVDASGAVYLTGFTASTDFPTKHAWQTANGGGTSDAFVAKVSPSGSSLVFSSYLGGNHEETGSAIALDRFGNIYVAGDTASSNFPVSSTALQPKFGGGLGDAFLAKIDPNGDGIVYADLSRWKRIRASHRRRGDPTREHLCRGKYRVVELPRHSGRTSRRHPRHQEHICEFDRTLGFRAAIFHLLEAVGSIRRGLSPLTAEEMAMLLARLSQWISRSRLTRSRPSIMVARMN